MTLENVQFLTNDRICVVDKSIALKLREASLVIRELFEELEQKGGIIKIAIKFCSSREFFKFTKIVTIQNESVFEFRIFQDDLIDQFLKLASIFNFPSLTNKCSEEICDVIKRGNISLDQIRDLLVIAKDYHLFDVFSSAVKFLCNAFWNVDDDVESKSVDDRIRNELKSKLPLSSVYVILHLLIDYRQTVQRRFKHEFDFEKVCKNPSCQLTAIQCGKCKFAICHSCGTLCNDSNSARYDYADEEKVCFNCKNSFRTCSCITDICVCSKCEKHEDECEKFGDCSEAKIPYCHWEDFLRRNKK